MTRRNMILTAALGLLAMAPAAEAQNVSSKKLDKANFYNAPRQFQILDERPIIHDFREAPAAPQSVQMPPPPQGWDGGSGGGGAGAMPGGGGDGGGSQPVQLPGAPGQLPYRMPQNPMGELPRSGFGRHTNIPARGMGPRGPLPSGTTTGVHAQLMPFEKPTAQSAGPGARAAQAARPANAAPAAGYGGNYRTPSASTGNVGGYTSSTSLSGQLLTKIKGNK